MGVPKTASTAQGVTTTTAAEVVNPPAPDFVVQVAGDTIKGTATTEAKGKQKKAETWEAKREAPEKKKD